MELSNNPNTFQTLWVYPAERTIDTAEHVLIRSISRNHKTCVIRFFWRKRLI